MKTLIKAFSDSVGTSIGLSNLELDSLQADSITDKAGTGAPDLPQGLTTNGTDILDYEETTITLGGDFTGSAKLVRIGNFVSLMGTSNWSHASLSTATSAVGDIPAAYRPTVGNGAFNLVVMAGPIHRVNVQTNGTVQIVYFDEAFVPQATTGTSSPPCLSWVII